MDWTQGQNLVHQIKYALGKINQYWNIGRLFLWQLFHSLLLDYHHIAVAFIVQLAVKWISMKYTSQEIILGCKVILRLLFNTFIQVFH